ncbi:MAG TPA: MFS transporter [Nocardioides sp.]|nr:MFS transporter [Nocardioides sp.]
MDALTSRRSRQGGLVAVLLSMLFLYQADATIVNVAAPSIRADLGLDDGQLELVVGGYLLASATCLITAAKLGETTGYRRMFLAGVSVFGLASLAAGLAPGAAVLVLARLGQGVGGACAFPQVLSMLQLEFPPGPERARALGMYSAALAGGAVAGQVLGGVIVSVGALGWRPAFLLNVPITVALVLAGRHLLPRYPSASRRDRLDVPGAVTFSSTVFVVVLPLTLGRGAGWPPWALVFLALAMPALLLFFHVERGRATAGRPRLINVQEIRRPAIAWALAAIALAISTYYGLLFTLALYLQAGLGRGPLGSALILVPWVIAFALAGRLMQRVTPQVRRHLPAVGCTLLAVAYGGTAFVVIADLPMAALLVSLAVGGLGLGTAFGSILTHLTSSAPEGFAAEVSGVFTMTLQIFGAVGVATFGALFSGLAAPLSPASAPGAFGVVTLVFAAVAVVAAVLTSLATRSASSPHSPGHSSRS